MRASLIAPLSIAAVEVRVIDIGDVDLVLVRFVGYTIHLEVSNLGTIWREGNGADVVAVGALLARLELQST